jgi:tetratricopeptide (TPR) repeat protein
VQAAKIAMFLSLGVAAALGSWYLRVRVPDSQWRRPDEAGRDLMSQGRFGEAERQFAAAVAAAHALGADDPRLALALSHQAEALVAQTRFADAIPLFERALAIEEKILGPDHPEIAQVLEPFAASLRETGQTAAAEAAAVRVRLIHARSARGHRSESSGIPRR